MVKQPQWWRGRACGKLILLGEHFVVHGTPALALPLESVHTEVAVCRGSDRAESGLSLQASVGPKDREIALQMARDGLARFGLDPCDSWRLEVQSTVPLGSGLGSSAAYAVALVRAFSLAARQNLATEEVNAHAHKLESIVHGTPSGIDTTTISHQRPVWFQRERPAGFATEFVEYSQPDAMLLLASSGSPRNTKAAVAHVHQLRSRSPERFASLCAEAQGLMQEARRISGPRAVSELGGLMTRNHQLLRQMGVSTPLLDRLVNQALGRGAWGAKLTGAGQGGFMVAAVSRRCATRVAAALRRVGATELIALPVGVAIEENR